jgi:hypothetical protein
MESRSLIEHPVKRARVAFQRSLMVAFHSGKLQTLQYDVYRALVSTKSSWSISICSSNTVNIPL